MRQTGFNVLVLAQWNDAALTDRTIRWCRESFAALTPFLGPLRYVNVFHVNVNIKPR